MNSISLSNFMVLMPSELTMTPEDKVLLKMKLKDKKLLTYLRMVREGNEKQKLLILDLIIREFDKLNYSQYDKKLIRLLEYLVKEGTINKEYENNIISNDFPEVRRKTCNILGKLKCDNTRKLLINVLVTDNDISVLNEACMGLAKIGDNKTGFVLTNLIYFYRIRPSIVKNFIDSFILALQMTTCLSADQRLYNEAVLILTEIERSKYVKKTQQNQEVEAINKIELKNTVIN